MGVPEEDRTDQIVRVRGIGVVVGVGGGSGRTSAADHRINIVSGGDLAGWYVAYNWLRSLLIGRGGFRGRKQMKIKHGERIRLCSEG